MITRKRNPLLTAVGLAAAVAATGSIAHADPEPDLKIGVGARSDIGGVAGYAGSIAGVVATPHVHVELAANASQFHVGDGSSVHSRGLSLAVLPVVARRASVALLAGLRVDVAWSGEDVRTSTATGRELIVWAPVRIEADVTSWLSLHVEGAVELTDRQPDYNVNGPRVQAGRQAVAGFTVWF